MGYCHRPKIVRILTPADYYHYGGPTSGVSLYSGIHTECLNISYYPGLCKRPRIHFEFKLHLDLHAPSAMNLSLVDPFVLAQEYPDTLTEKLSM